MESLQTQMQALKTKLLSLVEQSKLLEEEQNRLKDKIKKAENEERMYLKQIQKLEEENKKLKVVSAISGNQEYKKLMKLKLNKLIKEVDLCIAEVKTKA